MYNVIKIYFKLMRTLKRLKKIVQFIKEQTNFIVRMTMK